VVNSKVAPLVVALQAFLVCPGAVAQLTDAPAPIAAPAIPPPPQLAPAPPIHDAGAPTPPRLDLKLPPVPVLPPVTLPAAAETTPADSHDTAPLPPFSTLPRTDKQPQAGPAVEMTVFAVEPGSATYPEAAQVKLLEVARTLKGDPAARLEVRAYAPAAAQEAGKGRRLALARFLAVRNFLVGNGVADSRIDAQALAAGADEPSADRVELYVER
jgi:hypothetical protein